MIHMKYEQANDLHEICFILFFKIDTNFEKCPLLQIIGTTFGFKRHAFNFQGAFLKKYYCPLYFV